VSRRRDPADVHAAMTGLVASYRRHQPLLIALGEMAGYDAVVGATYRDIMGGIAARLAVVIRDGQDDGFIRPELTADAAASALTWMAERTCQQTLPGKPPSHDAELAATLTQIVWATLYLDAP